MNEHILPAIHSTTKLFLSGPFGSGKTTLALERIRWLLRRERTRGDDIIVLTPQRTLGRVYFDALYGVENPPPGPVVQVSTVAGLARNAVELYWPLLAATVGFTNAKREPVFLNLETAQYHMARFVDKSLAAGDFDGIRVQRSRVISQVLDNLNKAAMQGFTIDEAYERLELAAPLSDSRVGQLNALRAARRISYEFRQLCLKETLIDYSLQVELLNKHVLVNDWSRTHLFRAHKHLIFDNVEEDNVVSHNLARLWLPHLESALILADEDAGFRLFLGADPPGGYGLAEQCEQQLRLTSSLINSPELVALDRRVQRALNVQRSGESPDGDNPKSKIQNPKSETNEALIVPTISFRFYPQMLAWVIDEVRHLVRDEGIAPGQIAILAPFVSDALRFSLQRGLDEVDIPSTTHRPSRALQDEPATRTLLTLAKLCHPEWGIRPSSSDVVHALTVSIQVLDPVRAHLLTRIVFPESRRTVEIGAFAPLQSEMQQRITFQAGEAFDRLRNWIYTYRAHSEVTYLDQFFARLFGEILSQPGFGFHDDYDVARIANQLVDSARNFRWALENTDPGGAAVDSPGSSGQAALAKHLALGREYVNLLEGGALGALFAPSWREREDALLIAPAYTYMMRNRPVDVQFWLDVGASGWWERLYQPLTHPYVLSQRWPANQPWTDFEEYRTRQQTMLHLLLGLIRRTRKRVYLGISEYSESGVEQRGALLMLINRLLVRGS